MIQPRSSALLLLPCLLLITAGSAAAEPATIS